MPICGIMNMINCLKHLKNHVTYYRRLQYTPPQLAVDLPLAQDFNVTIALDFNYWKKNGTKWNKNYIHYMVEYG